MPHALEPEVERVHATGWQVDPPGARPLVSGDLGPRLRTEAPVAESAARVATFDVGMNTGIWTQAYRAYESATFVRS